MDTLSEHTGLLLSAALNQPAEKPDNARICESLLPPAALTVDNLPNSWRKRVPNVKRVGEMPTHTVYASREI